MTEHDASRRSALRALGGAGAAALALGWMDIARAAHDAHAAASASGPIVYTLLAPADAADVEALTSQIVPTDDTPGAREAGVTFFIDRALGSFFAHMRESFMTGLAGFQQSCRAAHAGAAFAALPAARQIEFLVTVERSAFFEQARLFTLCGMFSLPKYGGNRGGVGWQLLGFEDRHVFEPPFGWYDAEQNR